MTTIVAIRRNNETMIGADGALNNESQLHHAAFGVAKAYKLGEFLFAEAGCCLLGFEFKKIVHENAKIFQSDSISMADQTILCDQLKSKIKYKQDSAIIIWGRNKGYLVSPTALTSPNNVSQVFAECFISEINEDHFITGSGSLPAEATYLTLLKFKPKIDNDRLVKECVKMAGNIRMTAHPTPYVVKL